VSFEKACSSAVVVLALISILDPARELAHFSARWDEWILLTAREQEGVFLFFLVPGFWDSPTSNLFLPRVTFPRDDFLI